MRFTNAFQTKHYRNADSPAGLYVHIPFCRSKCPYCSFYSVTDFSLAKSYLDACMTCIESLDGINFNTVYIGGGTPSALTPALLSHFFERLCRFIGTTLEFTVEANPESVSKEFCKIINEYPVNRISLGIQSFDEGVLKKLGRIHDARKAEEACALIRSETSCRLSMDFIYDIPGVEYKIIKKSFEKSLSYTPSHISAYSYTPDTGFLSKTPAENPFQMQAVGKTLESYGYNRYEISNYAPEGHESVHNKKYWLMQDFYGVGAAAHSMVNMRINGGNQRLRYMYDGNIENFICGNGKVSEEYLIASEEEMVREDIVFGLRLAKGVDLMRFKDIPEDMVNNFNILTAKGLLEKNGTMLRTTAKGTLLLDSIMSFLY